MQFKLITPEKTVFSGDAQMVTIPGSQGEFGVLEGHAPFVSTLRPGVITIDQADGGKRKVVVLSGIAEVTPEHCVVLAESAQDCTNVTHADAQAKLQDARKLADDAVTELEKKTAAHQLALAEVLVQAA